MCPSNICLSIGLFLSTVVIVESKTPLYVGVLLPRSNYWFAKYGLFFEEIFKLAFEEIGNRTDLLTGYELRMISKDTEGVDGMAGKRLQEMIFEPPTKIALLGPPLSDPFTITAKMTPYFNLLQIGYVAKTSAVKDKSEYRSRYLVNYIEDDLNPLRIKLMEEFGWTKVSTLVYDEPSLVSQINEFHELLKGNYTLRTSAMITDASQIEEKIRRLKQFDSRIIFGAIRSTKAPAVFCEIYRQGLYGSRYVWILTGSSMYENWIKNIKEENLPCPRQNIYAAANWMLTLDQKSLSLSPNTTYSGWIPSEYQSMMEDMVSRFPEMLLSRSHPFSYDAAWTLALGLNNSLRHLGNKRLEDFSYDDSDIFNAIDRGMSEVDFEGVSGPISFNEGRRIGISYVEVNIGDDRTDVGEFYPSAGIRWSVSKESIFEGNEIPKDSFVYINRRLEYSRVSLIIVLILTTLGFAVAIACLVFNVYYRKNKNIKMSSPKINNLIIAGAMLMFIAVVLAAVDYVGDDTRFVNAHCMVNVWIVSVGFTISFGALFSKTWRVHVLFRKNDLKRRSIKDFQLFGVVALLVLVDLFILLPWSIFHPLQSKDIKIETEDTSKNVKLTEINSICHHDLKVYWQAALYIYKGLLLAFGAFIAWETRHIAIPSLNDSKYIGFCVYNIVVVCTLYVPVVSFLPDEDATLKFVLSSCVLVFTTTLVLCILFVPKIKLRNSTEDIKFVPSLNSATNGLSKNKNEKQAAPSSLAGNFTPTRVTESTMLNGEQGKGSLGRKPDASSIWTGIMSDLQNGLKKAKSAGSQSSVKLLHVSPANAQDQEEDNENDEDSKNGEMEKGEPEMALTVVQPVPSPNHEENLNAFPTTSTTI